MLARLIFGFVLLLSGGAGMAIHDPVGSTAPNSSAARRVPLAVLGDSDSQGFQDIYPSGLASMPRGGSHHDTTFQWTEALARIRGDELDLGEWGVHGVRGRVALAVEWAGLARTAESLGWEIRAPKKRDHRYNFAYAGDGCADLFGGWSRQVPRLLRLMDADASYWRNGVVVIMIGGNDFGNDVPNLDRLASDPESPEVRRKMDFCIGEIRRAIHVIRQKHPETGIVLVGAFDNSNWEKYGEHWRSPLMLTNISKGLDYFDAALQKAVDADPRMALFSNRKWFEALWGRRSSDGSPDGYRTLALSPAIHVTNTGGDSPFNATLADGHAGLVWNAKWAQAMIELINRRFGAKITPLSDDELTRFVLGTGAFQSLTR